MALTIPVRCKLGHEFDLTLHDDGRFNSGDIGVNNTPNLPECEGVDPGTTVVSCDDCRLAIEEKIKKISNIV